MYDWTRFWCLTSESPSISDDGFLFDPLSAYGAMLNPAARVLADLADNFCLVLLGEPGIGKSTAVRQQVAEIRPTLSERGDCLMSLDLGEYGDESRLIADLFESPTFRQWAEGRYNLHLFLDSLDECRLQIPHAAKIIARGLERRHGQLGRLRLRISCRTADWPAYLTERLGQFWENDAPAIYELLPLRRSDVLLAANHLGVDGDNFVSQVIRSNTQPFAIKPITLQFLLNVFKENGELPGTQSELYKKGCLLLCEESNPARQSANQSGRFSAAEKLAIAELIGAVIVFCNKAAVSLAPTLNDCADDDVSVAELTLLSTTNTGRASNPGDS